MPSRASPDWMRQLFDRDGHRKYLVASELRRFLRAAGRADEPTRVFCCLLADTGCRLSEALALTADRLDPETCRVAFLTLKRRQRVFRAVPVSRALMRDLHRLARHQTDGGPLWRWCRQTAWRRVRCVMDAAGIAGAQAMPKALRHGFGITNAEQNVPPALTQRWMGHARLETTGIYQHAVGAEERAFARRVWRRT